MLWIQNWGSGSAMQSIYYFIFAGCLWWCLWVVPFVDSLCKVKCKSSVLMRLIKCAVWEGTWKSATTTLKCSGSVQKCTKSQCASLRLLRFAEMARLKACLCQVDSVWYSDVVRCTSTNKIELELLQNIVPMATVKCERPVVCKVYSLAA